MRCTQLNQVWKHFHETPLSHSEAHYLMTIYQHRQNHSDTKAAALAKALELSAPTVSQTLKTLAKKNWIKQHEDRSWQLTDNAEPFIKQIIQNKALLMDFFVSVLALDKTTADQDSCKIEHLLSPQTAQSLESFLHKFHQTKR